ncbi:MAG: type II toxin-antitoxin system HicA family toxin [Chloroflexota bacterium]|nr:type II toxin-antitoxin system HicA family toxin [Chloroflexota bacterium]
MSRRLTPLHWRELVRVFEADGFQEERRRGSHIVLTKRGVGRPVVIPQYRTVGLDIIKSNMRTAGMSRQRFFELLDGP